MKKIREILEKYKYKFIDLEGDLTEGIEIANFDKLEKELQELINSTVEEEKNEKKLLLRWLLNLNQKIMRFDEFRGLRGYPLTYFQDKYKPLPQPPKEDK